MKRALFLFFLLPLSSFAKEPASCVPNVESCSYYLCAEQRHTCGPRGYALGFGFRFCRVFLESQESYSPQAHQWLKDVRVCLMNALENTTSEKTCGDIRRKAFHQHIDCYMSTGFCDIQNQEKLRIVWGLRQSFLQKSVIQDAYAVAKLCAARKAQSPEDLNEPR